MAERVETGLAVIAAEAAVANAAEWQIRGHILQQSVVDATAAEGNRVDDSFLHLVII